ncbi:ribokinase-like isoform X1 [Artemia franciscana]|uniref:Ribokinase n=1 Tax=Artemia franciscana TaxID=6661 RepID=A0AA88KSF9_ARTSF|nr:hypothetical protein QYM36_016872 [Artemia franciscana]KAK2704631.1 hypothetical protein QYM36_016872 [Artemia franciscana]
MAVVVVGSLITDIISYVERLPQPGETIRGKSLFIGCGGKGANQCVAAAKLGAECTMIGKLGPVNDPLSRIHIEALTKNGVQRRLFHSSQDQTGSAIIMVDKDAANAMTSVLGANADLKPDEIDSVAESIQGADVLVAALGIPLKSTIVALKKGRKHGIKIIFNAAPAASNLPSEVYQLSSVFCVNESEAEMLTGEKVDSIESADRSAQILQERGCKVVLITLGSRGAYLKDEANNGILIAAPPVKAVDTTGAGDSFIGALAYYMAYYPKLPLQTMVERSCQVAAFSVQKPGTQISFPTKEELPEELFL